jgi:glyoxylase-like metal-dependent hydrolase (beta-lactamase superfamily II)
MLELRVKPVGEYQSNCYVVLDPGSRRAVLIDAGGEAEEILGFVEDVEVTHILITHGHIDHVGALESVRRALNAPVGIHPADAEAFDVVSDFLLQEGDSVHIGENRLEMVYIPGHTPGSVAMRVMDESQPQRVVVGDAIFPGGPGHTRTPADLAISLASLASTVFTWDDGVTLYPGHGEPTTVGAERKAFERFHAKPLPSDLCGDVTWR